MAQARFVGLTILLGLVLALSGPAYAIGQVLVKAPKWSELGTQEHQVLAPLATEWDRLEARSKTKWLGVARRYPSMTPEEQERVQARMKDWAKLTPEQRAKARDQYRSMRSIPPEQRETLKNKWQEYESLSAEERQRLKDTAPQPASPLPTKPTPATGATRP